MTSTSHRAASAASCCRLKGDESGSSILGKTLVSTSTRIFDDTRHASSVPSAAMHIVHVVSSLAIGGQERMILDLARGLRGRGHRVTVISLAHGGALTRSFGAIPLVSLERRGGIEPSLTWHIADILRGLHADVVHTHNPLALTYAGPAARWARVSRLVHTKHGANPPRSRADLLARRAFLRLCDAYVAVSEPTAAVARELDRAPERLLRVIPNGIDTEAFSHDPAKRVSVRAQLGIPANARVIGTVGRLAVEKAHRFLVAAVSPLLGPQTRLVIVGDGSERSAIEEAIPPAVRPFVHLPGARDDIPAVLSAFDVFVLSSSTEGLPLVVPEAMAAGLPVVSTDVGGLSTVVRHDRTGRLVPFGDEPALRRHVDELLRNDALRAAHGSAAVVEARERFGLDRVVRAYEALYR